jgi:hypothetical protein
MLAFISHDSKLHFYWADESFESKKIFILPWRLVIFVSCVLGCSNVCRNGFIQRVSIVRIVNAANINIGQVLWENGNGDPGDEVDEIPGYSKEKLHFLDNNSVHLDPNYPYTQTYTESANLDVLHAQNLIGLCTLRCTNFDCVANTLAD